MAFSFKKILSSLNPAGGSTSAVGIDIGSSSAKVVELEWTGEFAKLCTYGELQLGPYADQDLGQVVSLSGEQQTEALVDVLRESQVSVRKGITAIPLSSSFVTIITVGTNGDADALANRVPVEAKKYIPLPLNKIALDWSELPAVAAADDDPATTDLLLVAIENAVLQRYQQLRQAVGMANQPAELESFSLIRALAAEVSGSIALIDCGASATKLYIVHDGSLVRLHRFNGGGERITHRLAELLSVPFAEAEVVKRTTSSGSPQPDIERATQSVLSDPLHEFARALQAYEAQSGESIGRVFLSGGVANAPSVRTLARTVLNREAEVPNPFARVAYPAFMEDTLTEIAPSFGVSLGAALRLLQTET